MTITAEIRFAGVQSPHDVLDWGLTLAGSLLSPGETITSGGWELDPTWAAIGVVVNDMGLAVGDGGTLAAWARVEIAAAERDHTRWDGPGTIVYPAAWLETSRGRRWWRQVPIRITRGAWEQRSRVLLIR